ncbi:hypothetical protein BDR06DRAFT_969224 [Suillus hirtellus]|nr:hypothetical protein BDR06DRAFT_969224 [Suillus hirtellus]
MTSLWNNMVHLWSWVKQNILASDDITIILPELSVEPYDIIMKSYLAGKEMKEKHRENKSKTCNTFYITIVLGSALGTYSINSTYYIPQHSFIFQEFCMFAQVI